MIHQIKEKVKIIKRRSTDVLARQILLHAPITERRLVRIARRHPTSRIVQWMCQSISREAAFIENRYRVARLKTKAEFVVDISDIYRDVYFYGADYEQETTNLILNLLNCGDVVFDIGANGGYYSIAMASAVGDSGHVHAFEPNPKLADSLANSVALNSFQNIVTVNQCAVSNINGDKVKLYVSQNPQNSGLSSLLAHEKGIQDGSFAENNVLLVETLTLDDYFRGQQIEKCDLIKIDVESAEFQVVQGMAAVLENIKPKFIVCETEPQGETQNFIEEFGYTSYLLTGPGMKGMYPDVGCRWCNILFVSSQISPDEKMKVNEEVELCVKSCQ